MKFRALLFESARHWHKLPKKYVAGCYGSAALLGAIPTHSHIAMALAGLLAIIASLIIWLWFAWYMLYPHSDRKRAEWRREQSNRHGGFSSTIDKMEIASGFAMFWKIAIIRPSMMTLSFLDRFHLPTHEYAILLMKAGWWKLWLPLDSTGLVVAPSGAGKTQYVTTVIPRFPGPVICASTKPELYYLTGKYRAIHGEPYVCDPGGKYIDSNLHWSVALGCDDQTTAMRRASGLLPATNGTREEESWDARARPILTIFLMAVALSHRNGGRRHRVAVILDFISQDRDSQSTLAVIEEALGDTPGRAQMISRLRGFYRVNDETRTSITEHIAKALIWLNNPATRSLGDEPLTILSNGDYIENPAMFNPRDFILSNGSLFPVADSGLAGSALIGALVTECFDMLKEELKDTDRFPYGRLDPPMLCVFDEADRACPINLADSFAEMRSCGIVQIALVQGVGQLVTGWGVEGAATIKANANSTMILGGLTVASDVRDYVTLGGEHLAVVDEDDSRYINTLDPNYLSSIGVGNALLLRHRMRPSTGRVPQLRFMKRRTLATIPHDPNWTPRKIMKVGDA